MAYLVSSAGTRPSLCKVPRAGNLYEVWVAYIEPTNKIYVRKRNIDTTWDTSVYIGLGELVDIFYADSKVHLIFEYNAKQYYRQWGIDEIPIALVNPDEIPSRYNFSDAVKVVVEYGTGYIIQSVPQNVQRIGFSKLGWILGSPIQGLFVGYNVYEQSSVTGPKVKLNTQIITNTYYNLTLTLNYRYYVTQVITPGYSSQYQESGYSDPFWLDPDVLYDWYPATGYDVSEITTLSYGYLFQSLSELPVKVVSTLDIGSAGLGTSYGYLFQSLSELPVKVVSVLDSGAGSISTSFGYSQHV